MKKTRQFLPILLILFCMVSVILPASAQAADAKVSNTVTYIPYGETEPHTIHWLQGITPPTMPGQTVNGETLTLANADFKLINTSGKILTPETIQDVSKNPDAEEYYVTEYLPGNGWYDINKFNEQSGAPDSHLCFAVSATDMMHWWMDQNSGHIDSYLEKLDAAFDPLADQVRQFRQNSSQVTQNPSTSRIYQKLIYPRYMGGGGGWPDLPIDYVFNGYPAIREAPRNTPSAFQGVTPGGGLFYPVFGRSVLTDRLYGGRYDPLNAELKTYMDNGTGVVLGYSVLGNAAHAVALWGVEYDENDNLCAIFITDNNDTGRDPTANWFGPDGSTGEDIRLISMIRYTAYRSVNPDGLVKITTYKDPRDRGSAINGRYLLTLAEEGWTHYEETGKPLYADGRAFLNPVRDQIQCEHSFEYSAANGRITRGCNLCGMNEWVEIRQREAGPFVYNGSAYRPYRMYSSLGDKYPFSPDISYNNNTDAGTASVRLSYRANGTLYSTALEFEIEKAPQNAAVSAPVLDSKTAFSVTLQAVEGMEYRMDGGQWQESPVFSGLRPASTHSFAMRMAEQKNYLPSAPSDSITVTTENQTGLWASQIRVDADGLSMSVQVPAGDTFVVSCYDRNGRMLDSVTHRITKEEAERGELRISAPNFDISDRISLFLTDQNSIPVDQSIQLASGVDFSAAS